MVVGARTPLAAPAPTSAATPAENFRSAVSLHQHGRLGEAAQLYKVVLKANGSDFDCLHNLGLIHAQEGSLAEAVELFRAAAEREPLSAEARNNLGNALALLERYEEATASFRSAIALRPDFAEAHNNLGNCLATQGHADEAIGHYMRAVTLKPDYPQAQVSLGRLLNEYQRRLEAAAPSSAPDRAIGPQIPEAYFRLGDSLRVQGRIGEATWHYQQSLAHKPHFAEAALALGHVFFQAERYDDALSAYTQAPGLADAWVGRGRTLKRLDRPQEAITAYRQALAKGGDAEAIRFFLAGLGAEPAPAAAPQQLISVAYDGHSNSYDQHMVGALKYRIPELLFDDLARHLPSRKLDVLDLGCGTGLLGARLRPVAAVLIGVDISSGMLRLARQRQVYDELVCGDLMGFLRARSRPFDLVTAADVFPYFGDLRIVFREIRAALKRGGLFGFSVEASEGEDAKLRDNLRYAHSRTSLLKLSQDHGFAVETIAARILRQEGRNDVAGYIAVLRGA